MSRCKSMRGTSPSLMNLIGNRLFRDPLIRWYNLIRTLLKCFFVFCFFHVVWGHHHHQRLDQKQRKELRRKRKGRRSTQRTILWFFCSEGLRVNGSDELMRGVWFKGRWVIGTVVGVQWLQGSRKSEVKLSLRRLYKLQSPTVGS